MPDSGIVITWSIETVLDYVEQHHRVNYPELLHQVEAARQYVAKLSTADIVRLRSLAQRHVPAIPAAGGKRPTRILATLLPRCPGTSNRCTHSASAQGRTRTRRDTPAFAQRVLPVHDRPHPRNPGTERRRAILRTHTPMAHQPAAASAPQRHRRLGEFHPTTPQNSCRRQPSRRGRPFPNLGSGVCTAIARPYKLLIPNHPSIHGTPSHFPPIRHWRIHEFQHPRNPLLTTTLRPPTPGAVADQLRRQRCRDCSHHAVATQPSTGKTRLRGHRRLSVAAPHCLSVRRRRLHRHGRQPPPGVPPTLPRPRAAAPGQGQAPARFAR